MTLIEDCGHFMQDSPRCGAGICNGDAVGIFLQRSGLILIKITNKY